MKHQTLRASALCMAIGLASCATYRPSPIEIRGVLEELESVAWNSSPELSAESSEDKVPGARQLAAFAISHNPGLFALRAELDVHQALLVEAGLLADPQFSWGAMDVLASQIVDESSSSKDVITGFGLMFPIPRPDEMGARKGLAEWQLEEVRRRIMGAEWELARKVFVACEARLAAERLAQQTEELSQLLGATSEFFRRAKEAGAVTAIEANLALGEYQAMQLKGIRTQAEVQRTSQSLNALLGIPPHLPVGLAETERPSERHELQQSLEELMAHALTHRPDLTQSLASYEVAEQQLRLAHVGQYPLLAIGTGFQLSLPIFSHFGAEAIRTAKARREQLSREYRAAVHRARQEIAAEHAQWNLAQREATMVVDEMLPNAERTLALSKQSFEAGEISLLETLALQRALVEARTQRIESFSARAVHAWNLLAASGWLLDPEPHDKGTNHEN
jgi:outer membrane protein TolC